MVRTGVTVLTISLPVLCGILLIGSGASLAQTGLLWRSDALQLDFSRISPLKGLARLVSMRSVVELIKGLLKIAIITGVGLFVMRDDLLQLPALMEYDMGTALHLAGRLSLKTALAVVLTLVPPPEIASITMSGTDATLVWSSLAGQTYRVQYKAELTDAGWTDLTPDVTAAGATATYTDSVGAATQRFYRISIVCP